MKIYIHISLLFFLCALFVTGVQALGWQRIFDGKTLEGWRAPEMSYFSVEDGAITGTMTAEHNPPYN